MIGKLRIKLIAASMLSLLAVLLCIEGVIGGINYRKIVEDADRGLGVLGGNEGRFPQTDIHTERKKKEAPADNDRFLSPELPYESRYFSVLLDQNGEVITSDTGKIATIGSSTAMEYAKTVWESGSENGFIEDYRYKVFQSGEERRIVFLDCGRNLSTFRNFAVTAVGVSLLGLAAVLVLLIFLSARIVKPFSENYEKQKRFITDAGHELKTPLAIIQADAEVLEMDHGESEWLRDIQIQTERMAGLTNDLILLARMEEEKKEFVTEINLSDMAEQALAAFQAPAKLQQKCLEGEIEPSLQMRGEEKAIERLFGILLDNAVKYSGEGGKIFLRLKKQKNKICLSVYNTTEKMEKEQLEHLFDRFYRMDQSRNSETGGYGLGLSIAAATVSAHRGKITASTEDGRSLWITATFPV